MKKIFPIATLSLVLLAGCTDDLRLRIDQLDEQVTELENQLSRQNETIASLYNVFMALNTRDCITGITQMDGNAGYVVHFGRLGDFAIYHGTDAHVPRVGIRRNIDDGGYYWTIQYGSNEAQYIINDAGNMVSAVGVVPLLKIDNGKFYICYDDKTWQYIGDADGYNGDSIFEKIVITDDYVSFITLEEEFKIPTYTLIQSMYQNAGVTNDNIVSLSNLVKQFNPTAIYISSVEDKIVDGEVRGQVITLSTGDQFTIDDWYSSETPSISMEKGENDELYYWAIVYSDGTVKWICDSDGNRMAASDRDVEIPVVVPILDPSDKMYYWNVVAAGDTTLLLDIHGNKVAVSGSQGEFSILRGLDNSNLEYIILTLANGNSIKIPKAYTISFSEESVTLAPGASAFVNYTVYGADKTSEYTLVTQGDIKAILRPDNGGAGTGKVEIRAGDSFAGNGKVMMIVTAGNGSAKVMTKSITVES